MGLRFYKAAANTGTHVGNLWSNTGTLLGQVTYSNETASGWQEADFSTPVPVKPNTTYVASYYTTVGHYSTNANYFASAGYINGDHGATDGAGEQRGRSQWRAGSQRCVDLPERQRQCRELLGGCGVRSGECRPHPAGRH